MFVSIGGRQLSQHEIHVSIIWRPLFKKRQNYGQVRMFNDNCGPGQPTCLELIHHSRDFCPLSSIFREVQYSGQVPQNMQYSGQIEILQFFGKGAHLCVIRDRFKNITHAIIQSDSTKMQYSGRGTDDSKYCNIRGKSSYVQYSGQVEEVAERSDESRSVFSPFFSIVILFSEKCNILVKCYKRCNIQVRLKYYNFWATVLNYVLFRTDSKM